jgi:hypothetical protein
MILLAACALAETPGVVAEVVLSEAVVTSAWLGVSVPGALTGSGDLPSGALGLALGAVAGGAALGALEVTESDILVLSTTQVFAMAGAYAVAHLPAREAPEPEVAHGASAVAFVVATGAGIGLASLAEPAPGDLAMVRLGASYGVLLADASLIAAPAFRGRQVASRYLGGGVLGAALGGALAPAVGWERRQVNLTGAVGAGFALVGTGFSRALDDAAPSARFAVAAGSTVAGLAVGAAVAAGSGDAEVVVAPAPGGLTLAGRW